MKNTLLRGESDVESLREMIARLGSASTVVDFEETMMLDSVRATTRLWWADGRLVAFAYVDDFNNLPLSTPISPISFPPGFSWRCVAGEHEVEALAHLHRAAFGTAYMTTDRRLAIMRGPAYERELDLVAAAADGELAAYCICSLDEEVDAQIVGYTDPLGTHPRCQRQGLGRALVTVGLQQLRSRGATIARLGTSSDNLPMQRLAEALGFSCIDEKLWFSKSVS